MKISAESDYACRALLELALNWPGRKLVQVSVIAKKQNIPIKYLEQILIELKNIGMVESVRGKQGGYRLVKEPRKISLGEVMRKTRGPLLQIADAAEKRESVFTPIWKETEKAIAKVLDKINFEDIANKAKSTEGAMVYQI
ncbi:MAG: Rrf2 family transcriptional regulator [Candidatus Omnitrophota bacterium]